MTKNPKEGDAVGAYKDAGRNTTSILPWILGLVGLLLVILLLLWVLGVFSDGVDEVDSSSEPARQYDDGGLPSGESDRGGVDTSEGYTPPRQAVE